MAQRGNEADAGNDNSRELRHALSVLDEAALLSDKRRLPSNAIDDLDDIHCPYVDVKESTG
jgi:hypothetical protein